MRCSADDAISGRSGKKANYAQLPAKTQAGECCLKTNQPRSSRRARRETRETRYCPDYAIHPLGKATANQGNCMNVVFIPAVHFSEVLALTEANSEHF
jgi:hypothetical protein